MQNCLAQLRRGLTSDGWILLAALAAWVAIIGLRAIVGINLVNFVGYSLNLTLYFAALSLFTIVLAGALLARHRPERPIGFLAAYVPGFVARLAYGAPMLVALVVFLPAFSAMKAAIPLFHAYTWDSTWIALDRTLHGTDPWRILQRVFGYPLITSALSMFYHLWILLIYVGGVYFCFFQADRELRARFFIAHFACWLVMGAALATALASVGPCFVGPLLGIHTYDAQMEYLRSANESYPVLVLKVQDALLESYLSRGSGLGAGISAMPSMHVSIAFLFFLAMRRISKWVGIAFGVFFVIILIGSVHLAYHYAVDGYVSIIVTALIWKAAGVLARCRAELGSERRCRGLAADLTVARHAP